MKYLGVKIVDAEPMTQGQQWAESHNGVSCCLPGEDREGYKVVYEDGYVSWSPKEVFEKAYRPITSLTFGLAIEALKQGKKVARTGWNGKGMYLKLQQGYPVNGHLNPAQQKEYCDGSVQGTDDLFFTMDACNHLPGQMLSHIVMKTAGDSQYWGNGYSDYVPWLASQTDMLAEDWMIIE
jgi:hypothetical protein